MSIGHGGGAVEQTSITVTVFYSDDRGLPSPPTVTFSGGAINSHQFSYDDPNDIGTARSRLTLLLAPGANELEAEITDDIQQTASSSVTFQYTAPPSQNSRMAPRVSTVPQNGVNRNPSLCDACSEAVLSYATPAYTSLDRQRAATLL